MGAKPTSFLFFKNSKRKAKILRNLDKDGVHLLAFETMYLHVLHSYTKGRNTYTYLTMIFWFRRWYDYVRWNVRRKIEYVVNFFSD